MILTNVELPFYSDDLTIYSQALKKAKIKETDVKSFKVIKRSLDARDKQNIKYVYSFAINEPEKEINLPVLKEKINPVIVGSGPAGLFCALYLARMGACPIVLEKGDKADERSRKIEDFYKNGKLDENSNIQFGEGGAGTFSDGKLYTGVKSDYIPLMLSDFVKHGANKEILYSNKAHIGSDVLPGVVKSIRAEIESLGGKFLFNTEFLSFEQKNGNIYKIITDKGEIQVGDLILALGNSARKSFKKLAELSVEIESKPFAVGLRIEHAKEFINQAQYGVGYDKRLPTADYKLTANVGGRGVFSFCMCPGGYVLPSTADTGKTVCNGMSLFGRNAENSNSAIIAQVGTEDYGNGVFDGLYFQERLEENAYKAGGTDYKAPVQTVGEFVYGKKQDIKSVIPSFARGYTLTDLNKVLPYKISQAIKGGIIQMGKKIKGFDMDDAVLTGVETRTSSPVRIKRQDNYCAIGFNNLYPIGEGAGYAGGITSSAVDGIKCAYFIAKKYV